MLLVFEGTGPDYFTRADFYAHHGFMTQFYIRHTGSGRKSYFDGPGASGADVPGIFAEGCATLRANLARGDRTVHLVGYSRGAFIAMAVARYCWEKHQVPVAFLGLFDAVSRASSLPGYNQDSVSAGVAYCCHASRNPTTGSRQGFPYFGNTGLSAERGVRFEWDASFACSHSGLGGWPTAGDITDPRAKEQEWSESTRAGVWFSNRARQLGVFHGVLAPVRW